MMEDNRFSILALVDVSSAELVKQAVGEVGNVELAIDGTGDDLLSKAGASRYDLVLFDPGAVSVETADGISFLKAACPTCEIALILGDHDITMDVELMRLGAYDSLSSPPSVPDLVRLIKSLMQKIEMDLENRAVVESLGNGRAQTIISHSPEMEKVLSMAARAAKSDSPVLITGESGTGKELIARAIHAAGPRKHKAFVPVNIAALQENLVESELFGHVQGSFTGAMTDRTGRFALAEGGTLFIDEIAELPPGVQVRLLRVLQNRTYERVGDTSTRDANVRIIAATNRDLEAEIRAGRFRADLYYRVNVVPVALPALRDHRSDIPYLAEYFIKKYAARNHKAVKGITAEAMSVVMKYQFPGNVRELENVLERGVVLCRGEYLTETDIFLSIDDRNGACEEPVYTGSYDEIMNTFEKGFLQSILARNANNKSAAARDLGINERRLRYRLKVLAID